MAFERTSRAFLHYSLGREGLLKMFASRYSSGTCSLELWWSSKDSVGENLVSSGFYWLNNIEERTLSANSQLCLFFDSASQFLFPAVKVETLQNWFQSTSINVATIILQLQCCLSMVSHLTSSVLDFFHLILADIKNVVFNDIFLPFTLILFSGWSAGEVDKGRFSDKESMQTSFFIYVSKLLKSSNIYFSGYDGKDKKLNSEKIKTHKKHKTFSFFGRFFPSQAH